MLITTKLFYISYHDNCFNMSDENSPVSPFSPSNSNDSLTISEESEHTPLYHSLEECLKHPDCVSQTWMDTIGDFKNNPRLLTTPPYNDGSMHWVDKKNQLLFMAFPAVLDVEGKYTKLGPYFSLSGDREVKVSFYIYITSGLINTFNNTMT